MVAAAATAQRVREAEITEQDSLLLTRNLLRIAIYNISYIRGLFPEKYFNDKSVPALEMKIKKLMPMDEESRRLIDWMEKGVYDALQKKYLKTLLFCICEQADGPVIEEYAFSFSYPSSNSNGEEVAMNVTRSGSKKNATTFKSNSSEVTADQMRSSACKMIRTLVSLMRTLDQMPDERTILMKLLYYEDVTPEDYEPPFFRGCVDNEAVNIWNKNPLKMEIGNVNSKHLVLSLKVKSILDPCGDDNGNMEDDGASLGDESEQGSGNDSSSSDSEIRPSEADHYVVAPNGDKNQGQQNGGISEEDTQDPAHEEELTSQVREWILSRNENSVNISDILTNFPEMSTALTEDIIQILMKQGLLSCPGEDNYTVHKGNASEAVGVKKEVVMQDAASADAANKRSDGRSDGDLMYMKALYYVLPMDYVSIAKLQSKLDGEVSLATAKKLIEKMVQDGYVKNSSNRRLGRPVIHSEATNKKLVEIKKILEENEGMPMDIDAAHPFEFEDTELLTNAEQEKREGSTYGCLRSVGSDLTRTRSELLPQNGHTRDEERDQARSPMSVPGPIASLESGVLGARARKSFHVAADIPDDTHDSVDKRFRKSSTVKEPILQQVKRVKIVA